MKKCVLAAVASFTIASGAGVMQASAADLFEPAPAPAPAPVFHDWSGFYVGGHLGYGEGDVTARASARNANGALLFNEGGTLDPGGILGGVHGGFNWQVGTWVLGVEGDVSFSDWDDSFSRSGTVPGDAGAGPVDVVGRASTDIDLLASVRGRLGVAFDQLLVYGTGGIAFADGDARVRLSADGTEVIRHKHDFDDVGFVVGGGAEWAAIPNRFSVGVEGLYYEFDDRGTTFETVDGAEVRTTAKFHDAWVVRARANFHFGGGPGPF